MVPVAPLESMMRPWFVVFTHSVTILHRTRRSLLSFSYRGEWETDEYDESGEFRVARRPLTYIGHLSPCPHAVARLV